MSDQIEIEVVEARTAGLKEGAERAAIGNAIAAVDAPHLEPVSAEHERVRLVHGWDNHGGDHLLLARTPDGEVVGYGEVEYSRWDNHDVAVISVDMHPAHRHDPTPHDRLLAEAERLARADGKTTQLCDAWVDTHGVAFWTRHGCTVGSRAAQRRIRTADLDWAALDDLLAHSQAASTDYDLVELPNPAPDDWLPALLDLQRAMNDAPLDDLALEDDVWTAERYRGYEQAMANRGIDLVRLVAQRRSDGAFGGFTVVAIEDERPHLGFQEDTAVVGGHRGHRLGLRLKVEMLRRLREERPELVQIDTWNAESNTHMLAVNDAIGCVVVGRLIEYQKKLD